MKHVVFILGSYFPNYSAVGTCAQKVIDCLQNDFKITVISIRDDLEHVVHEKIGLVDIVRVETKERSRRLKLMSATSRFGQVVLKLHRLKMAFQKVVAVETVDDALVKGYVQALESLSTRVDIVIPLVFPVESVLAALAYKKRNPQAQVYPYLFDDFVESRSLHLLSINRILKKRCHLALERNMLEKADAVIAMNPLRAHFSRHFDSQLLNKTYFLEHPLLSPPADVCEGMTQSTTIVSFTGSLIKKVREPDYLVRMLMAMQVSGPVQVDFYVMGNNAYKVKNVVVSQQLTLRNHGRVPKQEASAAVSQSNILLNLGEVLGRQVSSKVFEYMSAGKPIIHLAYVEEDSVSAILSKYPLALCLVQKPELLVNNARLCAQFIEDNKHKQLSFTEVAELFPEALPSVTADFFRSLFRVTLN